MGPHGCDLTAEFIVGASLSSGIWGYSDPTPSFNARSLPTRMSASDAGTLPRRRFEWFALHEGRAISWEDCSILFDERIEKALKKEKTIKPVVGGGLHGGSSAFPRFTEDLINLLPPEWSVGTATPLGALLRVRDGRERAARHGGEPGVRAGGRSEE